MSDGFDDPVIAENVRAVHDGISLISAPFRPIDCC